MPQLRPEQLGARAPETDQTGEHAQRLRPEMVLDNFQFLLHSLRAQARELKQFGQRVMPHHDVFVHRLSLFARYAQNFWALLVFQERTGVMNAVL